MPKSIKLKIIIIAALFLVLPLSVSAFSIGDIEKFYVERDYDFNRRGEISAVLIRITDNLIFYIEEDWWEGLETVEKERIAQALINLSSEFDRKIYPELTSVFGKEAEFGADGEKRITVLVHRMPTDVGGYFSSGDIYEKIQYPKSNQRKMVYLNSWHIDRPEAKSFLAHEFMHLITVNQKDLLRNVTEEIWLNEARAEFAPTLLGYDDIYKGSNLERRVNNFLSSPSDSLTEWLNRKEDYGVVNLFTQYLVDHYDGVKILVDSLQSNKIGIESINYALAKNGFKKDFSQIFTDWAIAVLVNDCNLGEKYCYLNKHLKDLRVTPVFYYFPQTETVLSTSHNITYWSANWYRFLGGEKYFILEFDGNKLVEFEIPYLLCDFENNCSVQFFVLDKEQKGKITVSEFKTKYSSLTIIPFVKNKTAGFNGRENFFPFFLEASTKKELEKEAESELIKELLVQIEELKKQIAYYQAKINAILHQQGAAPCGIDNNLYFGVRNNMEVRCLQEFLKAQGPQIYPEGLVTGNFLSLTQQAVVRFQEKYAQEILYPLNLQKGTGYVGPATRIKINQLINF